MKRVFTILLSVLLTANIFSQSPEKMSYQAVIRNANDNLVTNIQVSMKISILQGLTSASAVYTEMQTPTTNANGLVSIEVGNGTTNDDFSSIDWVNGPFFIMTEIDPAGGTNHTITSMSQILSVPYALHAKSAETISGSIIETDPVFSTWDKTTGISVTRSQISDFGNYIENESDPSVPLGTQAGQMQYWNDTTWVTDAEWVAELASWSSNNTAGAFASTLKLPLAGSRISSNGSLLDVDSRGRYWSSTAEGSNSRYLVFHSSNAGMYSTYRGNGNSVRCLKD